MKKSRVVSVLLLVVMLFCSCSADVADSFDFTDRAMGSDFKISLRGGEYTAEQLGDLCAEALSRVRDIENAVTREKSDSDLCRFNSSQTGVDDADISFQCVLSAAFRAYELTDGAFDPTIGALTDLWRDRIPSKSEIASALDHTGQSLVGLSGASVTKVDELIRLDLDGIARGYALEKAICVLSNSNVKSALCSFSDCVGCFRSTDDEPFTLEEADHNDRPLARLKIDGGYVSRSAISGEGQSDRPVIDPLTGNAASGDLRCVIVHSSSGAFSDALSTALLVCGTSRAIALWRKCDLDFDAVFVTNDTVYVTGLFASAEAFELLNSDYKLKKITEK